MNQKIEGRRIAGFPEYFVTNTGRVFSTKNGKLIELKKKLLNSGYEYVTLCGSEGYKVKTVHRLVAEAWIPMDQSRPDVNHKDGNKLNNDVENLAWCSKKENNRHSIDVLGKGHAGEKNGSAKLTEDLVREIRSSGLGCMRIAEKYGISFQNASRILRRERWAHLN